jgi:hypothetical protein
MGPPTLCEHCGKKLKVFTKRRKCTHCHLRLCRGCVEAHVSERHPNVTTSLGGGGGSSSNLTEYGEDDDDVYFLSPQSASGSGSSFGDGSSQRQQKKAPTRPKLHQTDSAVDLLDDLEGVDVVDVDENEDDDEDDGNDDDLLLGEFSRRASVEEEQTQFREFTLLQHAVEKWAKAEIEIKRQQRLAKQSSRVLAKGPIPNFGSTRAYQQRELFCVSYAAFVTVAVWIMCAFLMAISMRVIERTLPLSA